MDKDSKIKGIGSDAEKESTKKKDKEALDYFKERKIQFLGQAGLAVATVGVAGTPAYNDGVAIITVTKLGLMAEPEIRDRWEKAIETSTDQRALNIAKNVKDKAIRDKLEGAADVAARNAVEEATRELDVRVIFLIDKSGSMTDAIEKSKEALSRILAGFPPDRVHVATFDTSGTVLSPKAQNGFG